MAFQYYGTYQPPQTTSGDFYVHPGSDFGAGLTGLGQSLERVGEQKREEEAIEKARIKLETMKQGAIDAYDTGDPDVMAKFSLANPEMSKAMNMAMEFHNERTEQNYKDSLDGDIYGRVYYIDGNKFYRAEPIMGKDHCGKSGKIKLQKNIMNCSKKEINLFLNHFKIS